MASNYDQIRTENIKEYGEGTRHLSFLGRLYTDRTHFIFELLQNAEDAKATKIRFELFDDRLEVRHDGRPFDELDVRGVCGVGEGTKSDDLTKIGKFGIGFKSVYAYTSSPEIHSGDESFYINNYVRPHAIECKEFDGTWTTFFVFAFDPDTFRPENAGKEIGSRLRNLGARTLLFLRKIKEIEYKLPNNERGVYLRDEKSLNHGRQVTVIGENKNQDVDQSWLIFERPVKIPSSDQHVYVEIAFRLNAGGENKKENIFKIKTAPLVVYFPTEKDTRFGFLIQGPYKTTPSRDNIPKDDDWNARLIEETALLLVDTLPHLKKMGLLTVGLLNALPIRMDDFPTDSMFYPIVKKVRETLSENELLPSGENSFVAGKNAKLARGADLRKLLNQEQLRSLFQSSGEIKWLIETITQDRNPDLRLYLINELEIEEITPEMFARKITGPFLQEQSDDWIASMYSFSSTQKALWKPGSGHWNPAGPLRSKPIIRLQDGTHVIPFRSNDMPNAYLTDGSNTETSLPIVKVTLVEQKEAYQFLSEFGVPELDIVAEVIEKILPKYKDESFYTSSEEHEHDIATIERAYQTDSHEKLYRLRRELLTTPFVLVDARAGEKVFKKPDELYYANDELEVYFAGNASIYFVSPNYSQPAIELFNDLGIRNSVRFECKSSGWDGHINIKDYRGHHERGIDGFDPSIEVDGLEHALMSISHEKSEFIWNNIAIQHSACIKGLIETSSRQTYEGSYKHNHISNFGQLLIETAWLPNLNGNFCKPSDLPLEDLPASFIRDEDLAVQLGMTKDDAVSALAEEIGVTAEDIELLKRYPEEFEQWKADRALQNQKPTFPERPTANPERRRERLTGQLSDAPDKEYQQRQRSVRTTRGAIDPTSTLRGLYTNDAEQMICQICKEEMPFIKRDGSHYFEAVEVLCRDHLPTEHEAQFLALCPVCAAMYNEFIKQDENAREDLRALLINAEGLEAPLRLGERETSIRFVERHYQDLKTILNESE